MIRRNLNVDLVSLDSIQRIRGRGRFLTEFCKALCERVRSAVRNVLPIGTDHRNRCSEIDFRSGGEMPFPKYAVPVGNHYVSSRRSFDNRDSCATVDLGAHLQEPFDDMDVGGLRLTERGNWKLIPERHS